MFAAHAQSLACVELLALASDVDAHDADGHSSAQIAAEGGEQVPTVSTRRDVFVDFLFWDFAGPFMREHDPYWGASCVPRIEQDVLRRAAARGMNTSRLFRAENAGS
ncbi:hypothetical protein [Burkholderia sp. BCC1998]